MYKPTPMLRAILLPKTNPLRERYADTRIDMYLPYHTKRYYLDKPYDRTQISVNLYPRKVTVVVEYPANGYSKYVVECDAKNYSTVRRAVWDATSDFYLPAYTFLSRLLIFLVENDVNHKVTGGYLSDELPF